MIIGAVLGFLLVGGACDSADPGRAGFFSGLSALSDGCYEERIETRERAVEEREIHRDQLEQDRDMLEARSAEAEGELQDLRAEHMALRRQIVKLNSDLAARKVQLDNSTKVQLQNALVTREGGSESDAARIESLRGAIRDARALVEQLSSL